MKLYAIRNWHTGDLISHVPGSVAETMYARSSRADSNHLTEAVRVLALADADYLSEHNLAPETWVTITLHSLAVRDAKPGEIIETLYNCDVPSGNIYRIAERNEVTGKVTAYKHNRQGKAHLMPSNDCRLIDPSTIEHLF